jgi:hypothetical protein
MNDVFAIKQALQTVTTTPKMKEWVGKKFPKSYTYLASVIREENLLTRNPIMSRSEFRTLAASFNIVRVSVCCLKFVSSLVIFFSLFR